MRGQADATGIGPITVKKIDLIRTLEKNRHEHQANFEKACDLYQRRAEEALTALMERIRKGDRVALIVHDVRVPERHTGDYTRVIGMLAMHQGDTIELSEAAYTQYVDDEWEWKRSWFANTMGYLGAEAPE
jgi:hypothetical protein